ncbi:MAG: hypothetical protein SGI73_14140 [Chloroflexota bacterium]|nr:hypothetical protein [Chloroflexota bacterium]
MCQWYARRLTIMPNVTRWYVPPDRPYAVMPLHHLTLFSEFYP